MYFPRYLLLIIVCAFLGACTAQSGTEVSKAKPVAPQGFTAKVSAEGVELAWKDVPGCKKYTLFWGNERGAYLGMMDLTDTSIQLSGLKTGQMYSFAVTCWNLLGESNYSKDAVVVYDNDPKRALSHLSKGNQLTHTGALREAQAYLSAAIRLDPYNSESYRERAKLYEKMARDDLAREDTVAAEKCSESRKLSSLRQPGPRF